MRRSMGLTMFLTAATGCAGERSPEEERAVEEADQALVGGHVASEAEYPATVYLGGCTGVKVGPRHFLSAAHCFGNPDQEELQVTARNDAQGVQLLSIQSITLHPQWTNCTACAGDHSMNDFGLRPDAALIVVAELTPEIPVAEIDPVPVQLGTTVTLTGYGCEGPGDEGLGPRLKVGDATTQDPLTIDGGEPKGLSVPGGYVATWGPDKLPGQPGLCPGDSGGPLYRAGTNKVVGINALVSGWPDRGPYGNWFTRLDTESRYDVWTWLDQQLPEPPPQGNTPCAGICSAPEPFSGALNVGNLGTGARCFESTTATLTAGTCGGFAAGRTLSINGTTFPCGQSFAAPAKRNGGYCVKVSAGESAWAWLSTW